MKKVLAFAAVLSLLAVNSAFAAVARPKPYEPKPPCRCSHDGVQFDSPFILE